LTTILTVVTLWSAPDHPRKLIWLGPVLAAAFMLKGMAVLVPLLIVAGTLAWNGLNRRMASPLAIAVVLFTVPVLGWATLRWGIDGPAFFRTLFRYDFIEATVSPVEGHAGSLLFYAHQLQKDQYEWLVAAIAASAMLLVTKRLHTAIAAGTWTRRLLVVWAAVTFLVPTFMATKLPWYLNSFFPLFAVAVASLIAAASNELSRLRAGRPALVLAVVVTASFGLAEGKLLWYSYKARDLRTSVQGAWLTDPQDVTLSPGASFDPADQFVLAHMVRATGFSPDSSGLRPDRATTIHVEATVIWLPLGLLAVGAVVRYVDWRSHRVRTLSMIGVVAVMIVGVFYLLPTALELWLAREGISSAGLIVFGDLLGCAVIFRAWRRVGGGLYAGLALVESALYFSGFSTAIVIWMTDLVPALCLLTVSFVALNRTKNSVRWNPHTWSLP
jgi:hypothetical protein